MRGAAQYGGGLSLFFPAENDDPTNINSLAQDALQGQRIAGYIAMRIDGSKPTTQAFAAGDLIHIFQILTDGEALAITGEESFRYTVQALQQGLVAIYSVVGTTATPVVNATPATITTTAGAVGRIAVTVNGRIWTNGTEVSSSDPTKLTIRKGGVWTAVAAGTSTITVTVPNASSTDTIAATIS